MKKIIASILVTILCVFTVACGSEDAKTTSSEATNVTEEASESPDASTEVEDLEVTSVNVAALKGPTAMGMVKLMDESDNGETGSNDYNFTISAAIDEITPKIVQGQVDIAAVPANLASVLYKNTSGEVYVLAVNTLGVLYIVENGDSINSVEDLRGKTIYASGKGATPEYALNYMLEMNGIDYSKDVTIEYKAEHSECVAALGANENAIAMLPQPFVTVAQSNNEGIRIALDMNKEWNDAAEDASLITGVVIARKEFVDNNPEAVAKFMEQYKASVDFVNANTYDASELIGGYDIVTAEVAKVALPYCNITFIEGDEMKEQLIGYLQVLYDQNPAAVGGELPDEQFYYNK